MIFAEDKILDLLCECPMTTREIQDRLKIAKSTANTALDKMKKKRLIHVCGTKPAYRGPVPSAVFAIGEGDEVEEVQVIEEVRLPTELPMLPYWNQHIFCNANVTGLAPAQETTK